VDPTPWSPGLNSYAALPTYPRANYMTSNSLFAAIPGEHVGASLDAMSVFQNALQAPAHNEDQAAVDRGREIFARAGCTTCHIGPALTNHRIVPVADIGTEPTRARSFAKTESMIAPPQMFAEGTPVPPPADAKVTSLQVGEDTRDELQLAWAHGGTAGGYKVPGLVGLAVSAPYLHDGGVAVGRDLRSNLGVERAWTAGGPDAANSLRALLDRDLRHEVVRLNQATPSMVMSHVTGEGHAYFVDRTGGFSPDDQTGLIAFLLAIDAAEY
jgi:hypothetical protein